MHKLATQIVKTGGLVIGHYARRLRRDAFPGVAVLCYHGVRDDNSLAGTMKFEGLHVRARELEAHCRLIRQTCHPINLADWRKAMADGQSLPARSVLVTFDDGYRSVFTLARPILERYAIPAVIFVCSDPVEQRRQFWHDAVALVHGEAEVEATKALSFKEWKRVTDECSQTVNDDDPHAPMSIAEVRELANAPGFEIGGHTSAHPILSRASPEQQQDQISDNKARLENWTGRSTRAFAYPNGRPGEDYTLETRRLVKQNGFEVAFTTRSGFATPDEEPLERSRFLMLAGISKAELAHRLCHSWRQ